MPNEDGPSAADILAGDGQNNDQGNDPDDPSAAEVLGLTTTSTEKPDPKPEDKPTNTEEPKDAASDTPPGKDKPDPEAKKPDEEAPEEDEFKLPPLDDQVAKALDDNPALKERWELQIKGVENIVELAKAARAEAQEIVGSEKLQTMMAWGDLFQDPEQVVTAYQKLGTLLAKQHGIDPSSLGTAATADPSGAKTDPNTQVALTGPIEVDSTGWYEAGYGSEEDFRFFLVTKETAKREALAELKPMIDAMKEWQVERQQTKEKSAFEQKLDGILEPTIKAVEAQYSGWKPSREQVADAVRQLPQLEPAEAVARWCSKEIIAHMTKVAGDNAQRGPELLPKADPKGTQLAEPEDLTAADVLAGR